MLFFFFPFKVTDWYLQCTTQLGSNRVGTGHQSVGLWRACFEFWMQVWVERSDGCSDTGLWLHEERRKEEILMFSSYLSVFFLFLSNVSLFISFSFSPLFLSNGTAEYFYCLLYLSKEGLCSFSFSLKMGRISYIYLKLTANHSTILHPWRIPWMEETGGLQSMGSQRADTTEWLTPSPPSLSTAKNHYMWSS